MLRAGRYDAPGRPGGLLPGRSDRVERVGEDTDCGVVAFDGVAEVTGCLIGVFDHVDVVQLETGAGGMDDRREDFAPAFDEVAVVREEALGASRGASRCAASSMGNLSSPCHLSLPGRHP